MKKETIKIVENGVRKAQKEFSTKLDNLLIGNKIVTNGNLAAILLDLQGYTLPDLPKIEKDENGKAKKYAMGQYNNVNIFVDPYMLWDDNRLLLYESENIIMEITIINADKIL